MSGLSPRQLTFAGFRILLVNLSLGALVLPPLNPATTLHPGDSYPVEMRNDQSSQGHALASPQWPYISSGTWYQTGATTDVTADG